MNGKRKTERICICLLRYCSGVELHCFAMDLGFAFCSVFLGVPFTTFFSLEFLSVICLVPTFSESNLLPAI